MSSPPDNPIEVLRLDPTASAEEVVRQAGALRQRAAGEDEVAAVRRAVQALTGNPLERQLHELLTHPRPCYRWPAALALAAAFRRPPLPAAGTAPPACPDLDPDEVARLLRALAAAEWAPPPQPLEGGDPAEPPEEIIRQVVEAYWQCLPFDPRG
jgi:hypothetical protein